MTILDSLIKYTNRGKCERLFDYQGRTFVFKGLSLEGYGGKVSLEEFSTELKDIGNIAETARALDDFHYHMCNDLSNPLLKENLTKEDLRKYTLILLGAQACMLNFRSALEAFTKDPQSQKENLDKSVNQMRNFVGTVTPELKSPQGKTAVSEAFTSVDINPKDVEKTLS